MIFLCIFAILTLYNIFEIKKSFFFHLKYLNTKNLLYKTAWTNSADKPE